jgi:hypothetical protein
MKMVFPPEYNKPQIVNRLWHYYIRPVPRGLGPDGLLPGRLCVYSPVGLSVIVRVDDDSHRRVVRYEIKSIESARCRFSKADED